ncbi:MAG TPA: tetratricopeptide repeat protein [Gammaproteobacteria bacterium]|nr:tetratricopeptide repeat protein [Gammaproteobacteria bacterium]
MSIINQMLRDLDQRRGPAFGARLATLQGMGLVDTNRPYRQSRLVFSGLGLLGLLLVTLGYQSTSGWFGRPPVVSSQEPVQALPSVTPETPLGTTPAKPVPATEKPAAHSATEPQAVVQTTETEDTSPVAPASKVRNVVALKTLTPAQKADRLFASAQLALAEQHQDRAEQLLRATLQSAPLHSDARTQLAALLIRRQRMADAGQLLAEGLAHNPYSLELAIPYAQLLADQGTPQPALEVLDRTMQNNPTDAEALALRAALLYRLDRHPESISAYRSALRRQPQRALWWTGLAIALEHEQLTGQALRAYRRAAALPLENAVAIYVQQRIRLLGRQTPDTEDRD